MIKLGLWGYFIAYFAQDFEEFNIHEKEINSRFGGCASFPYFEAKIAGLWMVGAKGLTKLDCFIHSWSFLEAMGLHPL